MNIALKNKLLILAAAASLAGFGVACSSEEAPAAEEGAPADATSGGEGEAAPPEVDAPGGDAPADASGGDAPVAEEPAAE